MSHFTATNEHNIKDIQNLLIASLQQVVDLFREHNVTYALDGGTLLGAIRTGGFIPWDDDIDLSMPRESYEKLILLESKLPKNLKMRHFANDPDFPYPFIRICNHAIETTTNYLTPLHHGVWIDIFPIDGTFSNSALRAAHLKILSIIRSLITNKFLAFYPKTLPASKILLYGLISLINIFTKKQWLIGLHTRITRLVHLDNATISGLLTSMASIRTCTQKTEFLKTIEITFEGLPVNAPSNYHFYLSNLYGNYMKPNRLNQPT